MAKKSGCAAFCEPTLQQKKLIIKLGLGSMFTKTSLGLHLLTTQIPLSIIQSHTLPRLNEMVHVQATSPNLPAHVQSISSFPPCPLPAALRGFVVEHRSPASHPGCNRFRSCYGGRYTVLGAWGSPTAHPTQAWLRRSSRQRWRCTTSLGCQPAINHSFLKRYT